MQLANQEAQRFNHEYIGTEHILLGLIKEGSGVAANVLKNLDVDIPLGVLAGVLIKQHGETESRLSFRSKGSVSVVETARFFGGGGHRNAAGAAPPVYVHAAHETVGPVHRDAAHDVVAEVLGHLDDQAVS